MEIDVEDDVEEDLSAAAGGQEEAESSFSSSSPSFPTPTSLPVDPMEGLQWRVPNRGHDTKISMFHWTLVHIQIQYTPWEQQGLTV